MQEINVEILDQKITSSKVYVPRDISSKFELNVECKANIKTPKDKKEKKLLLNIELNIKSKDEKIKIELIADVIFELNQFPDDYSQLAEKKLIPMARNHVLHSLDDILVAMGYGKMELANKI